MPNTDLYIRVSTDEQAVRGYSLTSQEDRLKAYCNSFGIEVKHTVFEDHSAKTFRRPGWLAMEERWRKSPKNRPDLLLFTRWDRFSRNITDSFVMINKLRAWDIEPRAIDQPLDLSIPENLMVLAMYLAVSEVENARRAMNVKEGMYRALTKGRWVRKAPYGYINSISPEGEKCIIPKEPESEWVKKVFELVSEDNLSVSEIHKLSQKWGMKCGNSNFYKLLRNPIYCGKIYVPAFERKKAYITKGKHKAIVAKRLFNKVQKLLQKRPPKRYAIKPQELLPLRGFICCPICHKKLTGSGSRGYSKRYFYYHCISSGHYRVRADYLNRYFLESLRKLSPKPIYISAFESIVEEQFFVTQHKQILEEKRISKSMENLIERRVKARNLLHRGEIDAEDYLLIKSDCERRVKILGRDLGELSYAKMKTNKKPKRIAKRLSQIEKVYHKANFNDKQKLISLLLREEAVLKVNHFKHAASTAAQIIFNLSPTSNLTSTGEQEPEESIMKKVWSHEKASGHAIRFEHLAQCIAFLRSFYQLLTH